MRDVRLWRDAASILGLTLALSGWARADVSLDKVTWGMGGDTLGWSLASGDPTQVTAQATGGNPDGFLAIDFDSSLLPQNARVANAGTSYQGDYRNLGLKFDFLGYAGRAPTIFFVSSAGGSNTEWTLDLDPAADHTWQPYNVDFIEAEGNQWVGAGGNFLDALAQVDSIGVIIHASVDPGRYGLDNWQFYLDNQFYVPEPGVTAMSAVLARSFFVWARHLYRSRRNAEPERAQGCGISR